jgi:hypothetical protein
MRDVEWCLYCTVYTALKLKIKNWLNLDVKYHPTTVYYRMRTPDRHDWARSRPAHGPSHQTYDYGKGRSGVLYDIYIIGRAEERATPMLNLSSTVPLSRSPFSSSRFVSAAQILAQDDPRPPIVETAVPKRAGPLDTVGPRVGAVTVHLIARPAALVSGAVAPDVPPQPVVHMPLHIPLILRTARQNHHAVTAVQRIVLPVPLVALGAVRVLTLAVPLAHALDFHPLPFVQRTVRELRSIGCIQEHSGTDARARVR